jgi:DNA repair photolyase
MKIIYEPKGRAKEYSELALNLYETCPHGCLYCFAPGCLHKQPEAFFRPARAKKNALDKLESDMKGWNSQKSILLCFSGDPFPAMFETPGDNITLSALRMLLKAGASVTILTKGCKDALQYLPIFLHFGDKINIGTTLTFWNKEKSRFNEPLASSPSERLLFLKLIHDLGLKTWASIEPVIDPSESLEMIYRSLPFVDHYKIGKLNHWKNTTDWARFLKSLVAMLRDSRKSFYIKQDLQKYASSVGIPLKENEISTIPSPEKK